MKVLDKIIEFEALDKKELGNNCFIKYGDYHDNHFDDALYIYKRYTTIENHWTGGGGGHGEGPYEGPIIDHYVEVQRETLIGYIYYNLSTKQLTPVVTDEKFLNDFNSAIDIIYKLLPNLTIQLKEF